MLRRNWTTVYKLYRNDRINGYDGGVLLYITTVHLPQIVSLCLTWEFMNPCGQVSDKVDKLLFGLIYTKTQ